MFENSTSGMKMHLQYQMNIRFKINTEAQIHLELAVLPYALDCASKLRGKGKPKAKSRQRGSFKDKQEKLKYILNQQFSHMHQTMITICE